MSDDENPAEQAMDDANALHEALLESAPPDLENMADNVLDFAAREAEARPIIALLLAPLVGFVFAAMTSR